MPSMLNEAFGFFNDHFRNLDMTVWRLIKGGTDDFSLHHAFHVGHFLGAFIDQKDDQHNIIVIGCDAVENDELTTKIIKQIGETMFPGEIMANKPLLVGEDFSAYNAVAPSTYIFIGAGNTDQKLDYPHHHPKFGLDETSFIKGLKMFVAVAANYNKLAK